MSVGAQVDATASDEGTGVDLLAALAEWTLGIVECATVVSTAKQLTLSTGAEVSRLLEGGFLGTATFSGRVSGAYNIAVSNEIVLVAIFGNVFSGLGSNNR